MSDLHKRQNVEPAVTAMLNHETKASILVIKAHCITARALIQTLSGMIDQLESSIKTIELANTYTAGKRPDNE